MNNISPNLQKLKEEMDTWLKGTLGIAGTGIGLSKDGQKEVVKVYISVPTESLSLPEPLPANVELEFIGEVDAQ